MRNSAKGRVPLRLIAEKAGVSRMTVSLALRASPSISKETGSRVQEIAQQLGYRPDPIVSDLMANLRLATQTQHAVPLGFVTSERSRDSARDRAIQDAYFAGAAEKAAALGYRLEEFRLHRDGMSESRVRQIMIARGIEGALLVPSVPESASGATMPGAFSRFCCVAIGTPAGPATVHHVGTDHLHSVMETCRQLTALGYRCPGLLLTAAQDRRSAYRFRAGFVASSHLAENGGQWPVLIRAHLDYAGFVHWMHETRPDVVIHAMEPSMVSDWLRRCGASVPDDVGHAGLELDPGRCDESGFVPKASAIGAAALELLTAAVGKREPGQPQYPATIAIAGAWHNGNTTRPMTNAVPFGFASIPARPATPSDSHAPLRFETSAGVAIPHRALRAS
jgi:LacI family transcriptional regulator